MKVKNKRIIFIIFLISILLLIAFLIYNNRIIQNNKFEDYKMKGNKFLEQDIDIEAKENFERALDIKIDDELISSLFNLYLRKGDDGKAAELISKSRESYRLNKLLLDYYYDSEMFKELNIRLKYLAEKEESLYKNYTKKIEGKFIYLGDWYDDINYSPYLSKGFSVKKGEKWGVINSKGNLIVGLNYDWIGLYTEDDYYPVEIEGEYFFIDSKRNIRAKVPSNVGRPFSMVNDLYTTEKKNAYFDKLASPILKDKLDTTNFNNNLAMFKDGGKWRLIDNYSQYIELDLLEVVRDEYNNFIFNNKIICELSPGKYQIYDTGKKSFIGDIYEYISIDYFGEAYAVKTDDRWKFIGEDNLVDLSKDIELAESFSQNLAIVKKDMYGVINAKGEVVIPFKYDKIYPFNTQGISFVKEEDKWRMIQLINKI